MEDSLREVGLNSNSGLFIIKSFITSIGVKGLLLSPLESHFGVVPNQSRFDHMVLGTLFFPIVIFCSYEPTGPMVHVRTGPFGLDDGLHPGEHLVPVALLVDGVDPLVGRLQDLIGAAQLAGFHPPLLGGPRSRAVPQSVSATPLAGPGDPKNKLG